MTTPAFEFNNLNVFGLACKMTIHEIYYNLGLASLYNINNISCRIPRYIYYAVLNELQANMLIVVIDDIQIDENVYYVKIWSDKNRDIQLLHNLIEEIKFTIQSQLLNRSEKNYIIYTIPSSMYDKVCQNLSIRGLKSEKDISNIINFDNQTTIRVSWGDYLA